MIRWGIAGPGGIAATFAEAMTRVDGGHVVAVASRSADRAAAFADRFGVEHRHADYEALARDPDVDAVYVATPHARHEADSLLYLGAGKHVLCEKPFALNRSQVERMAAAADQADVFLMEAMWSRFLPAYRTIVDAVGSGRIGTPLLVDADFGFRMPEVDPAHRLFDLAQGGGSLLDLGIYPIHLCQLLLGPIEHAAGSATLGATGVDEQVAAVLRHQAGGLGVVRAAIRTNLACAARVSGTDGWIDIPAFMHCPTSFSVNEPGSAPDVIECPLKGNGFEFQIAEVHRCIESGLRQSPTMPLADSLALATVMDAIRTQIGLTYPDEHR
jgi:predicted dehydrogenase